MPERIVQLNVKVIKDQIKKLVMKHVSPIAECIRMLGSASLDLAYVACGRVDGNFTFLKNPWDILPGLLMCEEMGMLISDVYGGPYLIGSSTLAVFSSNEL